MKNVINHSKNHLTFKITIFIRYVVNAKLFSITSVVENTLQLSRLTNALFAVSKGMWAVKLCSKKIFQFLTWGAG